MVKERVHLEKEKETLLIPLFSKAEETKKENPILCDPSAVDIVDNGIAYDWSKLKIPEKTKISLCLRAKQLDRYVQEFINDHPAGTVVHLGCGLDSRCRRVDNGKVKWYDLDFPEVIALRKRFFPETERYHLIASSVTALTWMDTLNSQTGEFMFVAEGLLMYLPEEEVKKLVLRIKEQFPGSRLACDVFSAFTVRKINKHPSMRETNAEIQWGIDNAQEVESWRSGIKVTEEWFFAQSPELPKLSWGFRLGFKIAGMFALANQAHRLLLLKL